jgi:hypothetical protein
VFKVEDKDLAVANLSGVGAALRMASTVFSAKSSAIAASIFNFGKNSTTYSAPR